MSKNNTIINSHLKKDAALIFSDGSIFYGAGIGKKGQVFGEICFNTALTGYQEILTDPSYCGQIITFTFPHIGNVGVNDCDIESLTPKASGLITREPITNPANYRSNSHLNDWLIKNNLTGISCVDTRQITKITRQKGAKTVAIIFSHEKIIEIKNSKLNSLIYFDLPSLSFYNDQKFPVFCAHKIFYQLVELCR